MPRWRWIMLLVTRKLWFRAGLFSLGSVLLALVAAYVAPVIPYEISTSIGSEAVDNILEILASSMLAVTTFSLTAMVSAYSGATATTTPRATQLLVRDSTAQSALATFLGAFLFSVVGICALSTGLYGKSGRVVLFAGTVVVILIIVVTLLRWIEHLSRFGLVADTISRVETVATRAAERSAAGVSWTQRPDLPQGTACIFADCIGYVTHVDFKALAEQATAEGGSVTVHVLPGDFVTAGTPLASQTGSRRRAEEKDKALVDAFSIADERQFDHDPRYGIIVLSEIASRALSPAVNDPGTAAAVIGAGLRVLTAAVRRGSGASPEGKDLRLPAIFLGDLIADLFRPIARDGAGFVEVAAHLQHALGALAQAAPEGAPVLQIQARDALARCQRAMTSAADLASVQSAYERWWVQPAASCLPG